MERAQVDAHEMLEAWDGAPDAAALGVEGEIIHVVRHPIAVDVDVGAAREAQTPPPRTG